jgi:hypothetical protein
MLVFHIGGEAAEYVRVKNLRDHGDGWFSADVDVSVGVFRGSYSANFNSWAFSDFHTQLEKLYHTLSGSAVFTSYEAQLELTLTCDNQGHIQLRGEAMDCAGTGNRLIFRLEVDQTYLPAILRDLKLALERYPPRDI